MHGRMVEEIPLPMVVPFCSNLPSAGCKIRYTVHAVHLVIGENKNNRKGHS